MSAPDYAAIADLEHRTGMPHGPDTEAACTDPMFHAGCDAGGPAFAESWRRAVLAAEIGVGIFELKSAMEAGQ